MNCTTLTIGRWINVTCQKMDDFPEEGCQRPLIVDCMNVVHLGMRKDYYRVSGNSHKNGAFRNISCADDAAPTSNLYPISTWGEEWYEGPRFTNSSCNNGSWMYIKPVNMAIQKPVDLTCFTKEQIRLLKEMIHYYKWTMAALNETNKIPFKWIDSSATLRMDSLVHAQKNAKRMWDEALEGQMATVDDFKKVINALIEFSMIHRGEQFNQSTCDDFQAHMMYQLKNTGPGKFANYVPPKNVTEPGPPEYGTPTHKDVDIHRVIPFSCTVAVQKSSIGWDYMNAQPVMYYRSGCYCSSNWMGGCPFQIQMTPSYQNFGFDSMTEKIISGSEALCWYWSTPEHPEWGYLWNVDKGQTFQAPAQNGTQLQNEWNALRKKKIEERKKAEESG